MYKNGIVYPYPSKRQVVFAKNGMVATSNPLAAQAGLAILKEGGNAIDAAIAVATCLSVVEPCSNGIGSDAFAIIYYNKKLYGLNASGKSPKSISIDAVKESGYQEIPRFGMMPITVPGAPKAWADLSQRFGKLSLRQTMSQAISYAKEGFPVSTSVAKSWGSAFKLYQENLKGEMFLPWFKCFAPKNNSPKPGDTWYFPEHAKTLEIIANTNAEAFYTGELADQIEAFSIKHGGFIRKQDLANHHSTWVEPLSIKYRGYDVWELPPNGQGLVALQALNILSNFDFPSNDITTIHHQIEAIKLAFADGLKYITDPNYLPYTPEQLLDKHYALKRSKLITKTALTPIEGKPFESGTVYLATADGEGNMVSYIQSNYMGFGSGIVIPNTGIAMQNRGHTFSLDSNHANALKGDKQTYHTIIPGFLTKGIQAIGPFGVMGGFMQPQGHVQVIMSTLDFGLNPQATLDAPRWQWIRDKKIILESGFKENIISALKNMGHDIEIVETSNLFGNGQIIWLDPKTKTYCGGTDKRTDGHIAAY